MRLADCILRNMEAILQECESLATLLPAAAGMSVAERRNSARQILEAVAADIHTPQTAHEQAEKPNGRAPQDPPPQTRLPKRNAGEEVAKAAKLLICSGDSIQGLIDDVVESNRTKLGLGIKVKVSECELAWVLGAWPIQVVKSSLARPQPGPWDGKRLQQLLRNLVCNALKYGSQDSAVRVVLRGRTRTFVWKWPMMAGSSTKQHSKSHRTSCSVAPSRGTAD